MQTIAIIGGGIAGLAAARAVVLGAREAQADVEVVVLERETRIGGKILTGQMGGRPVEGGPDSFAANKPSARRLCEDLGLADELVAPGPDAGKAYLYKDGSLVELPRGFIFGMPGGVRALLGASALPLRLKARALVEPAIRKLHTISEDESVFGFSSRRFGKGLTEELVEPIVTALYGDARRVSLRSAMPDLYRGTHGASALRQLRRMREAPVGGPAFVSLRSGMQRLPDRLGEWLGERVRTRSAVESIKQGGGGYSIELGRERLQASAVVLAVPATVASRLLGGVAPQAAGVLKNIRYLSSAVVQMRFPWNVLKRSLDASGFLVAPVEDLSISGCTWIPSKWPHLKGESLVLRAFVRDNATLALQDGELAQRCAQDVAEAMQMQPGSESRLQEWRVVRWPSGIPFYEVGHAARIAAAEAALPSGIYLAGGDYRGVGLPECVVDGETQGQTALDSVLGSQRAFPRN